MGMQRSDFPLPGPVPASTAIQREVEFWEQDSNYHESGCEVGLSFDSFLLNLQLFPIPFFLKAPEQTSKSTSGTLHCICSFPSGSKAA